MLKFCFIVSQNSGSEMFLWECVRVCICYHAFTYLSLFIGMSESEQSMKGTSQIKILNAEEIEGMRVVCKVNQHHNLPNHLVNGILSVAFTRYIQK